MSKKTTSPKDRKGVNPQRRPAKTPAESPAEPETPKKEEAPAPASSPTTEPPATTDQPDAKVDRPSQEVLSRLVKHWQQALARFVKAQAYLKGRGLWVRELLVALCIGYSSGKLPQMLPRDGKIRRQLIRMGILNQKANEFFYKRLVIPIVDENGVLVNVYGRAIDPEAETPHLYLPGPHRGVFNLAGIREAPTVIVTEALLDAVSLLVLGFLNTTASYGANGFTADHKAALLRAKTTRVYCAYDADPAGDHAADQLAHDLAGHGIEVLRVQLPCKDPNDFLKGGGTREQFQALLDQAVVIPVAGTSSSAGIDETTVPSPAVTQGFEIQLGDRTYTIGAPPLRSGRSLSVLLRVSRGERFHVDTLNLYLDTARARFIARAYTAFRGQVPKKALEEDFFAVLDEVEKVSQPVMPREETSTSTPSPSSMSEADHEEALAFLDRLDLVEAILADLTTLGLVGEDDNKFLAYLVATSRKLDKPLSLSVISRASAGKSWLLTRVIELMPVEDVMRYTRISPRALFYDEPGRYKNKILFIEEAIGAKEADLPVRSMQSERRLSNLVTMTDPKTGKLKTQETVVEGPLTYLTSSVEPLDYETATRSFEIAIDESVEQTARVVARQFHEHTLDGVREHLATEAIVRRHRNAQRLIEPFVVVNPHAPKLRFPTGTLRLRREALKYLSLMAVLALLHQHQRPVRTFTQNGVTYRYVEVYPADVDRANRLMAECLARALSDLPGPAQELLLKIQAYVTEQAGQRRLDPEAITFNRREIRERLEWDDRQLRRNLDLLAEQEYVEVVAGSFGKRYVYRLSPDHRLIVQAGLSVEEKIRALGLTASRDLETPSRSDLDEEKPTLRRKP